MPLWAAGIGAAVSLFGGSQANKQAKKDSKAQAAAQAAQLALQREQLDFGKAQYADFRGKFDPLFTDAKDLAYRDYSPNMGQIQADYGSAIDSGHAADERNMARYGMNPSDGAWGESSRQYGMTRGVAIAGEANRQRMSERGQKLGRIEGVSGMLSPISSMASGAMSGGYAGMSNAYQGQANAAGDRAAASRNQANASYGSAATFLGQGMTAFNKPAPSPYDSYMPSFSSTYPGLSGWSGGASGGFTSAPTSAFGTPGP
jgi:type II secretory pathway pseudopilin PulG